MPLMFSLLHRALPLILMLEVGDSLFPKLPLFCQLALRLLRAPQQHPTSSDELVHGITPHALHVLGCVQLRTQLRKL